jgi:hypothetical protein
MFRLQLNNFSFVRCTLSLGLVVISGFLLSGCELPASPVILPTLSKLQVYQTAGITPFVTTTSLPQTPTATIPPSIELSSGYTKVYGVPDMGFPIRSGIRKGEEFEIIGRNTAADWVQIEFQRDQLAWIPMASLNLIGNVTLDGIPQVDPFNIEPAAVMDWKGSSIRTLCLNEQIVFAGSYAKDHPDDHPADGFTPQVKAIMRKIGIQAVSPGTVCDATLSVKVEVEPRGKSFVEAVSGTRRMCYTGVEVRSSWELTQSESKKAFTLTEKRGAVDHPLYCAPISQYQNELTTVIYSGINKLWGDAALPGMLQVDDPVVNDLAIELAAAGGRHSQAVVPDLITFLDNPDLGVKAYWALKTITGKGYLKEAYLWKQWWDTQLTITPTP